jgi:light-regulated signal transduction histidine kinase (bacteriophytochrome)
MKHHDLIFQIFQRLHRSEDFAGTGVGLAIVKKAMDRMGVHVWAEGVPDQGAEFFLEFAESRNLEPANPLSPA